MLLLTEFAASATSTEIATAPRRTHLSFTVVTGHLRGTHACPYELHATGCRDLRKLSPTASLEITATDADSALAAAMTQIVGTKTGAYYVQPCTNLRRMRAAGRA